MSSALSPGDVVDARTGLASDQMALLGTASHARNPSPSPHQTHSATQDPWAAKPSVSAPEKCVPASMLVPTAAAETKEKDAVPAEEEDIAQLARQNRSLLRRLDLGLGGLGLAMGWLHSTTTSAGSSSKRNASGNTLEKGFGRRFSGFGIGSIGFNRKVSRSVSSRERAELEKEEKTTLVTGGKADETEIADTIGSTGEQDEVAKSGSGSNDRALPDDELFYRSPIVTPSTGQIGLPSPAQGSFSASFGGGHVSSGNDKRNSMSGSPSRGEKREANQTALSWLTAGQQDPPTSAGFSIGIPSTPETGAFSDLGTNPVEDEGGRTADTRARSNARWCERSDRIRFPVPPSNRESVASTGESE